MRENVMDELHQIQSNHEAKRKMLEILKRVHSEYDVNFGGEEGNEYDVNYDDKEGQFLILLSISLFWSLKGFQHKQFFCSLISNCYLSSKRQVFKEYFHWACGLLKSQPFVGYKRKLDTTSLLMIILIYQRNFCW